MTPHEDPLRVGPGDPVGSSRLAAALESGDAEAIGRALRMDVVVVPLIREPDGSTQVRVTSSADGRLDLVLFSSSAALAQFLEDAPSREFEVRRGATLVPFLEAHRASLARVVFDPAGPHPVAAPVDAVIDSLRPRPDDDEVRWITQGDDTTISAEAKAAASVAPHDAPTPVDAPQTAVDFRWAMPLLGWTRVVPDDLRRHPDRMTSQLAKAAKRLPRPARDGTAAWVASTAIAAARDEGLREVAATGEGRRDEGWVIVATRTWHPAVPGSAQDFDATVARLAAGLHDGDQLVSSDDAFIAPTVRHTVTAADPSSPGGWITVVDYLLAFPGGGGFCRARFATPQPDRRDDLVRVTAPIVAGGQWVTRG